MSESIDPSLLAQAEAWIAQDPDAETRAELKSLVISADQSALRDRLGPELDFGTAGLRAQVGAGPARMNRAVVMRAVRALADYLWEAGADLRSRPVVVGYDARPSSRAFAEAAAGVLLARGLSVRWFETTVATPLVAFAARVFSASAALVITASHNPRGDNGLKIYGPDARQLSAPADAAIASRRGRVGPARGIPSVELSQRGALGAQLQTVPCDLFEQYLTELGASLPIRQGVPAIRIAYTPLHGVGLRFTRAALERRGFTDFHVVAEQAEPDGAFPTCEFPNPEQPGTLDRVLELAAAVSADLVLANDPDADRLAAAVSHRGKTVVLSGNELGCLLADFVLARAEKSPTPLFVTSIVSSPLLERIAHAHGAACERTLTGFKWIWGAGLALQADGSKRFAFGCEEALGYSVGQLVRDKDGIAAAVWLAELAAVCRTQGETLLDRLHAIYRVHGAWGSAQVSLVQPGLAGAAKISEMIARLAESPPERLGTRTVTRFLDFRRGQEDRPPWLGSADLFELSLGASCRVLVRPSGTEPKLKIYADVREPVLAGQPVASSAERAHTSARTLAEVTSEWLTAAIAR